MPDARVFVDATTLLYTIDKAEPERGLVAQNWLTSLTIARAGRTNLQALNEVASVVTRKAARFPERDPFLEVDAFAQFGSTPLSPTAALAARSIFRRYKYSWWDCLLLAAALELGCTHFLSEDMQDGHVVSDGTRDLTIIDPFAHSPQHVLTQ
jgi:predicted nucleic acid-binding protein